MRIVYNAGLIGSYASRSIWLQSIRIFNGIRDNLDVSWYSNPEYGLDVMHELRLALKDNLDIEELLKEDICSEELRARRIELTETPVRKTP